MSRKPMTMSGFCAHPSRHTNSHLLCSVQGCTCTCHTEPVLFAGRGVVFAVIDDREDMPAGALTNIDVIAGAIDDALEEGHDTPDAIARYITTSTFRHITDRRVRYNSILKASDLTGAHMVRKLVNAYNELLDAASEAGTPEDEEALLQEAYGFAEAFQIMMNPYSVEDEKNPHRVMWDTVYELTDLFQTEHDNNRKGK